MSSRHVLALVAGCLVLGALTLLLPSTPTYDPWSWLIWGREILSGDLQTTSGPSWKPLTVLVTTALSVTGDAAPSLWLVVARAATFGAVVVAVVLGSRLAGAVGGAIAGVLLLLSPWLWAYTWLGNSEGLLILCVLAAIERHLAGRLGQAFAFWIGAALLRPEAWPFVGIYGLWLVLGDRARLRWVAAGFALIPLLWLLPELWGSGSLWRGADRAQDVGEDSPALAARPALAVIENVVKITPAIVRAGLLCLVGLILLRRLPRPALAGTVALAAVAVTWAVGVATMAELGFSGINRYLLTPLALLHVLAAIGFGLLLTDLVGSRRYVVRVVAAAAVIVLLLAGCFRAVAVDGPHTVDSLRYEAAVLDDLDRVIARAGGRRTLLRCGALTAHPFLVPAVAWKLRRPLEAVTARPPRAPAVVFRTRHLPRTPVLPPEAALAALDRPRVAARTRYWEIRIDCGAGR